MTYPDAKRLDLVEDLLGRTVSDPYRWLEDPEAPETQAWSRAQDELWSDHVSRLVDRDHFRERLRALMPGDVGLPACRGERLFYVRRAPDQEHPVLVVREPDGEERVLVDPMALDPSGTTTLDQWAPSKEGDRLAYQVSEGGDEESSLWVVDVATGEVLDGPIGRCRYSPVGWIPGGEALYYVRRLARDQVPEGEAQYHRRVWLHRVGSDPETDAMVFGEGRDLRTYYSASVSSDGRWLIVSASIGTEPRNDVYLADLHASRPDTPELRPVVAGEDALVGAKVGFDGRLYLHTNLGAPRWRLAVADPAHPDRSAWRDLLPETDSVLDDVALLGDAVVATRTRDVVAEVTVHDAETGALRHSVALPGLGSVLVTARPDGGDEAWIRYTDHVTPAVVLHHHAPTRTTTEWAVAPGAPDTSGVVARQVFYQSLDGTRVPMFLLAPAGAEPSAPRPTILNGYGGFNIALTPAYSPSVLAWVEAGGLYAVANLRGGAEYGEDWHRAGMRDTKQNVFDDFAAAAEHLIAEGWSTPDRLGISGGSNGGLLVGAALTQRPDLFASVVCSAPLLDMVRYERFGLGATWNDEYGTAADPTELGWLLSYSPYHRVEEGTAYPAVLFTVFESDTRVDPLHARKLCAALQWATSSDPSMRPVLLRRETDVGHGQRSVSRTIDLGADVLAFQAHQLGLDVTGVRPGTIIASSQGGGRR